MSTSELHTIVLSHILLGWLIVVLAIASYTDLYQRRIPNLLTYPTILSVLLVFFFFGGLEGFLFSLRGLLLGLVVFVIPYAMGGMGAGDVKLMCAVGSVLGLRHTAISLLFIAISGGVLAFGLMLYRRTFRQTMTKTFLSVLFIDHHDTSLLKINKNELTRDGIPFAVAITSGVCLLYIYLLFNEQMLPGTGVL